MTPDPTPRAAYDEATKAAYAAYDEAVAPARAALDEANEAARAATKAARAALDEANEAADAAYDEACLRITRPLRMSGATGVGREGPQAVTPDPTPRPVATEWERHPEKFRYYFVGNPSTSFAVTRRSAARWWNISFPWRHPAGGWRLGRIIVWWST